MKQGNRSAAPVGNLRQNSSWTTIPYLLLVIPPLLWGGNAVLGRHVVSEIPPLQLSLLRWALSLAVLLPFTIRELVRCRSILRARWKSIATLSFLGVVCFGTSLYVGLQTTTAVNAGLWQTLVPALIVVLSRLILGTRLTHLQTASVALSALGVLLVLSQGKLETLMRADLLPGDIWVLFGVLCWASYSTLLMKDPLPLSPMASLTIQTIFALPLLLLLAAIEADWHGMAQLDWVRFGYLFYLGPIVGAFAVSLWIYGISMVGPPIAGVFLNLIPVFAAALGYVLLDEAVRWFHIVGGLAIGMGILLMTRKNTVGNPDDRLDERD